MLIYGINLPQGTNPLERFFYKFDMGEGVQVRTLTSISPCGFKNCGHTAAKIAEICNFWYKFSPKWYIPLSDLCSEQGHGRSRSPFRPLLAAPNVTAHPSTASVPNTVLLYNGLLLCGFNAPVKGLYVVKMWILGLAGFQQTYFFHLSRTGACRPTSHEQTENLMNDIFSGRGRG